ncbi:6-hydroxy-D-nicotine oxidase [Escovopsis weberi]|uniref:6-hydroxy-D-nicotine oxidase n=1 Tax=Escovopsis weberi TaxID=150374 RepID=A0A0M9VW60_ESCWE|nr:6-hydroxy-D-nicotine oxidase [Escovopsis weberi]
MVRTTVASAALCAGVCRAAASPSCGITHGHLGISSTSQIFLPSSPDWAAQTLRWSSFDAPTYSASVRPSTEADVQAIGGIEIDMSAFRNVSVDAANNLLTVGGGARFLDVFDPVFNAGKEISTGSGACVGMISPALGGGVGRLSGTHGVLSDQLSSLRVVTANGSIVTASDDENPDLFWAMRGAGNNFGIVTEAVYRVMDQASRNVINMDYAFTVNDTGAIIDYLSSFGVDLPAELSFIVEAMYNEAVYGGFGINVNAVYVGPQDEAEALLAPLLDAATPFKTNITSVAQNQMVYSSNFGGQANAQVACGGKGGNHSVFGGALYSYDKPTFVAFMGAYEQLITGNEDLRGSVFFIEHFSNVAVQKADASLSSYPWRNITAHLLFNYAWTQTENAAIVDAFGKKWRSAVQKVDGFDKPELYVNYGHGDEAPEMLYSEENLPKLKALKSKWDPTNQFRFNNNLMG